MEISFQQLLILEYFYNNNYYSFQEIQEKLGMTRNRLVELMIPMIDDKLLHYNQENLLSITPTGGALVMEKSIKWNLQKSKGRISKRIVEEEYLPKTF